MSSFEVDYSKQAAILERLFSNVSNSAINGYVGDSIKKIGVDECGNLEFLSIHQNEKVVTTSVGAVLKDSIVIKQTQENANYPKINQLYSWNLDCNTYSYLLFDNEAALELAYKKIKYTDTNLCTGDITEKLQAIDISFDDIAQIRVNEKPNNEELDDNSITLI